MAAKMAAFFIEMPIPLLEAAKPYFLCGLSSNCFLGKKLGIKYFNSLLAWLKIKFLHHWPEKASDFVKF